MIDLDGRTGEGGGQLVRIAVGLAAVTGKAVRISNIRGNRRGGGGLKAQHVSAVAWLASATGAAVDGLAVGSSTLVFRPSPQAAAAPLYGPIVLRAATAAASTSLILQAVLPFLLLAGGAPSDTPTPIQVILYGGTHVAWAPSYDYLDQVLFPALASWFGIRIVRTLAARGWATGQGGAGQVRLLVHPLAAVPPGMLALTPTSQPAAAAISTVDATILAPADLHELLTRALARALDASTLADADLHLRAVEDSGHDARVYVLLVARTGDEEAAPVRCWGCDYLGTENIRKRTGKKSRGGNKSGTAEADLVGYCDGIAKRLVQDLADEVARGGCGDRFLQDQVVVFQALAAGRTSFWRGRGEAEEEAVEQTLQQLSLEDDEDGPRPDRTRAPFGQGSLHTQTARWVTAQMLPVQWYRDGTECAGSAWGADGPV